MKKIKWIGIISLILVNISLTKTTKTFLKSSINKCSAILEVEKNRNTKSIFKDDITYKLNLTNTSNKTKTFSVNLENLEQSCLKIGKRRSNEELQKNVKLNSVLNIKGITNSKENSFLILKSGESTKFTITIKLPKKTAVQRWNCTKVNVVSKECDDVVSTVLKTYVLDPSFK